MLLEIILGLITINYEKRWVHAGYWCYYYFELILILLTFLSEIILNVYPQYQRHT